MIISHKHKFIFIKTRKTAGTSIELFLSRFCGPEDIITPFQSPENERNYSKNYFKKEIDLHSYIFEKLEC